MVQLTERLAYRNLVSRLIRELTITYYSTNENGEPFSISGLTQRKLAASIGVTPATLSRAATGVTSLSGECFYLLCKLHSSRLSSVCQKVFSI